MKPLKIFAIVITAVVLLVTVTGGALFAAGLYGYNQITYDYEIDELEPVLNTDAENLLAALLLYTSGNIEGAVASVLESVEVSGSFIITNGSFTSLYIPEFEHEIAIAGVTCGSVTTEPIWVSSDSAETLEISCEIDKSSFGDLVEGLMTGGTDTVTVSIESTATFGPFTFNEGAQLELEPADFADYFDFAH